MLIRYFRGGNFFETAFYNPLIDDFDIQVVSATPTRIVAVNPGTGVVTTFTGTGFPASAVPPLSGTLTGFSMVNAQGQVLATVTGINWGLQATLTAIEAAVGAGALGLLSGLLGLQPVTLDASDAVERLFGLDLTGITANFTIIGSNFADEIFGGNGNDSIDAGAASNTIDAPDRIYGSAGSDILDFSGLAPGNSWLEIIYEDLTGPITLNINALTNTGSVSKGPGQGTDTLIDVATALDQRVTFGVDLYGTTGGDSFTVRTVEHSGIYIAGGRGADTYNLTLAEGSGFTLGSGTYDSGPTQGLVFNATTGVIANDGFGFAETLTLTRLGDVNSSQFSIFGTRFADNITGSTGRDRLRSNGGNDTINGGGGFDRIQYDRNQLTSGVTVDLVTGVATGSWSGVAFTHTLSNIEEVSGSRFDDTFRGSAISESLVGNDGLDLLDGRGGDDDLIGGTGNDSLIGGTGNDYLEGGDGNDRLDGSADPTGFGDYMRPGLGTNTILGSQTLYQVAQDGIDISYSDVSGVGGLTILVGANGSGTVTSGIAGRVNDTFTWTHFFQGSQDADRITVTGSSGDWFEGFSGYAGNDTIDGGSGYDDIDYRSEAREHLATAQGIVVNLATGLATDTYGHTDTLHNIEAIRGTHLVDRVTATNIADAYLSFRGYAGADVLNGTALGYERADYSRDTDDGGTLGIRADLAAGTVIDGFGNTDRVTNIDEVRGTRFNDVMTAVGTSAAIQFGGEDGNDTLRGGSGNDRLRGDGGNDSLFGGAGSDEIEGGSGNDFINPGDNSDYDYIEAGAGNDTISFADLVNGYIDLGHGDLNAGIAVTINGLTNTGSVNKGVNGTTTLIGIANPIAAGAVLGGLGLRGTDFNDSFTVTNTATGYVQIQGGRGADTFTLQPGSGTIRLVYDEGDVTSGIVMNLATGIVSNDGYGFVDTIIGGGVNDIRATRFVDVILGSAVGHETYILEGGNDTVNGGGGYDIVRFDRGGVAGVNVDLAALTASGIWEGVAFTSQLVDIDEVRGSREGNDTIRGDGASNLFLGRFGNDFLDGRGGNDTLEGEDGNDTLVGGAGNDSVVGGTGSDVARFGVASTAATFVLDADGNVVVTSAEGQDLLVGIEALQFSNLTVQIQSLLQPGSAGSDSLRGSSGNDSLSGLAGNDRLDGRGGEDTMNGGLGNDTYFVDSLGDVVTGEVAFGSGGGIDTVFTRVDFVAPANVELLRAVAGAGNLNLTGNDAPNTLVGNEGANRLEGRGGNDQVNGNAGADTLVGGEGADTLVGGAGADSFVFLSVSNSKTGALTRDVINGFERGAVQDRIDLSAIDARSLTFGNDAFVFIGTAAFTGAVVGGVLVGNGAGQLRLVGAGPGAVIVAGDVNGDGVADIHIFINGQTTMVAGDFIL